MKIRLVDKKYLVYHVFENYRLKTIEKTSKNQNIKLILLGYNFQN
jgi:hypothetical protein